MNESTKFQVVEGIPAKILSASLTLNLKQTDAVMEQINKLVSRRGKVCVAGVERSKRAAKRWEGGTRLVR